MRCTSVRFVDTNILLYAISRDPAEQDKAKRANDILAERDLGLLPVPTKRALTDVAQLQIGVDIPCSSGVWNRTRKP